MKHLIAWTLAACLLTGCAAAPVAEVTASPTTQPAQTTSEPTVSETVPAVEASDYVSRFDSVTDIVLSDQGVEVTGSTDAVTTSNDIIYYEDRDSYDSGNPYGEGTQQERHTAEEAAVHTVVNITAPGAYRVSGTLSAGQIRIDLGEEAEEDPEAVVELILDNADITCTVAPIRGSLVSSSMSVPLTVVCASIEAMPPNASIKVITKCFRLIFISVV